MAPSRGAWATVGFGVAAAALMLARFGYAFESGDQAQYLLLPYRQLFDSFAPGDWFTWDTTHYHVTFSWLVRALALPGGVEGLPYAVAAAHGVVLVALGAAFPYLARACGWGWSAAVAAVFVLVLVRDFTIAGALLNHGMLLPADAALPALLFACGAWLRRRPLAAGAALGVSGFLHANYAILGPLVLGPLLLADARDKRALRSLGIVAGVYTLLAAPTLWTIVSSFLVPDTSPEAMRTFFYVRSPHHYDIGSFKPQDAVWMTGLLIGSLPALWHEGAARRARWLALVLVGWLVVAVVGSWLGSTLVIRAFLWRLSLPLAVVCALGVGESWRRCLTARSAGPVAWAAATAATLFLFGAPRRMDSAWPVAAASLLALAPGAWLLAKQQARGRWALLPAAGAGIVLLASSMGTPRGVGEPPWRHAWKRLGELTPLDASSLEPRPHPLLRWVRSHAPADALFLIPPHLAGFRVQTQRGMFVDWKSCPMRGDEVREWTRRMLALMGTERFPARGYRLRRRSAQLYLRRPPRELAQLARREGLTHVVARFGPALARPAGLELQGRAGGFHVYRVTE